MIQAVIFDMDGLLTDSEEIGLTVMQECGKKQGFDLDQEIIKKTVGTTCAACQELYNRFYPGLDGQKLFKDFRDAMYALAYDGKIPLKKGARELIAYLRERGIPMAVASSSTPETIQLYLEKAGVLSNFSVLVSGEKNIPSKPAPDIFLKAAEKMHVAPENCLVLEDSINGIKAGHAAGMIVCMVPDLFPFTPELQEYCDAVKEDLAAVIPLMEA